MKDKINQLLIKRQYKNKEYNATPSNSWKRRLRLLELQMIDNQIKIERLKRQYQ